MKAELSQLVFHPSSLIAPPLLRFLVPCMFTAAAAEFLKFKPLGRRLLIFRRRIITTLTIRALQHYVIAWHNLPFKTRKSPCHQKRAAKLLPNSYSTISETVPAPTVRPPSRIANLNPFSIAIGAINVISIATLSPGITISTPSGNVATPVTSVVRK